MGTTSNILPTTPATYFVLETGPLSRGCARVSIETTSSKKDKSTYLLITHLTRLDKLPEARTMHEGEKRRAARHPLQTQRSGKPASRAPCPFSIDAVLSTIFSYVLTHDPSPSLR